MPYFNYFIIVLFFQEKNNKNLEKKNNSNQININNNDNKNFCNINNNFQNNNFNEKDKKIKNLEENINLLNKQLLEKTNKINTLSKENSELKQKIVELNLLINKKDKEHSLLRNKINELNSKINNQIDPNNSNNHNKIVELYEKIEILQEKLKRFPFILEKNEKLMSIIFSSVDQKIHFSIICKNTDTINKLEAELYREYPQFSETDNYFMCKGKVLNKFHPFESDNIKNGDVIIVNQRDIQMN